MGSLELKVPPPLVGLAVAALMWLAFRHAPALAFDFPGRRAASLLLVVAGAGLDLAGVASFLRARTTVNPLRPGATSALVTSGVYRFTRNPMYLGMLALLLAWGLWLGNGLSLALVAAWILYIDRLQIRPEERVLAARFGEAFAEYCRSVRRWL